MFEFFRKLFSSDFMPHGTCYLWNPAVLWLNVISDLLIAAAYYAIPFLLIRFWQKRRDLTFRWIFVAFGVFIVACGTTHLMGAIVAWVPVYRLDGVIKAITAAASIATFLLLIPTMPALIAIPSPSELARINLALSREVEDRRSAEEQVRQANEALESRVAARTAELAASESRFRQLAEAMPQMVWIADAVGALQYANGQWVEYSRRSVADLAGNGWLEIVHPGDRESTASRWRRSVESGELYETEYRLRHFDGSYRWFLTRGIPVFNGGGSLTQWFGTCTDIDDRKRAAEALERTLLDLRHEMDRRRELEDQLLQSQKMEAIGRLAGGVAHDFNNLLTAILGYNEIVIDRAGSGSEIRECAEEVAHAAERAAALTNQLLAFSRRQIAEPRLVDLNQCVTRMERMLRRIIGEDVQLVTRLAAEPETVRVDPSHIDQVILNLAVNSRDAMPDGGTLLIETTNVELAEDYTGRYAGMKPGRYAVLAVRDTGAGMDAATRAHIFEPFFTTKEPGKGTGLGLSIVYGIVKQNGGEVLVSSEPGKGTAFEIYIPAIAAGPADAAAAVPAPATERATETVLLVEDEEPVRRLARRILAGQGYRVLEAGGVGPALELARTHPGDIHLLLTDVVMPQTGGPQLAEMLAAVRPGMRTLYMSGYTDSGIVQQGVLAPGTTFLAKPFTAAALLAKVRDVLRA
jgi:two-component system, cell cycle sensor histidine kinase and response regulator CckA